MNQKLLCGTAITDITPEGDKLKGLYGLMSVPYVGVIDTLALRVLAFASGEEKALIISFDLDKAPYAKDWIPMLAERTGIPEENITYLGTHTHSAPYITPRPRERKKNITPDMAIATAVYEDMVKEKLIAAVDEAMESLRPAKIGCGKGKSYINVNRNAEFHYEGEDGRVYPFVAQGPNSCAEVERTVFVFEVRDEEDKPMAFFINYPVHCCTMFLNNFDGEGHMGISADIAGAVSRMFEKKYPGSVAVWSSGAAGDVNPIIANEVFYADSEEGGKRKTWLFPDYRVINELMLSLASRLYDDALNVVRNIDTFRDTASIGGAIEWSETPAYELESEGPGKSRIVGSREAPYRIRMHLLRIGEIALCGIGGELYNSFGRLIQQKSPLTNTVVINHEASLIDDAGYIQDDETIARVNRGGPVAPGIPGGMCCIQPGFVGDSLVKHTASLFRKVIK